MRLRRERIIESHLGALFFFILLTVLMTWPYTRQITTSLYNWSDALLNTWALAWGTHALLTDPLNLYNANIFYPYRNTLAFSESLLPQTMLAMPIILASDLPSFGHNVLALASFALSGLGAYLLVFQLTRARAAGIGAGLVYGFTSYKFNHFPQLQLLSAQWMPFALLYLQRLFSAPRSNARHNALLFAIFFILQALSSFYYAFFIAIAAALYVSYMLALHLWKNWRTRNWRAVNFARAIPLVPLAFSFFVIAAITIPPALPYFSVQREVGLERDTGDVEYYAAPLRAYFSVPDNNLLYRKWLAPKSRITGSWERDFVGFAAIGLALIGLVSALTRRDAQKWFYVLLGVVAFVLSLGARSEIVLFPGLPHIPLPFYLPYRYLFLYVPGFKAMRGPDRFGLLVVLALAVLAGYGIHALVEWLRAKGARPTAAARLAPIVLSALIVAENLALPVRLTNPATLARPLPPAEAWLARQADDGVILEIPLRYDNQDQVWPQYYSAFHGHRVVNGFSGFFPPGHAELTKAFDGNFPSEQSLALLDELGVRYVIVHKDLLTSARWQIVRNNLAQYADRVALAQEFSDTVVYRVQSRGWGNELAAAIPSGAQVEFKNDRTERRLLFETAAAFLPGRQFNGKVDAAFRPLAPSVPNHPPDFVIVNSEDPAPPTFTRSVWANDFLAVYAR